MATSGLQQKCGNEVQCCRDPCEFAEVLGSDGAPQGTWIGVSSHKDWLRYTHSADAAPSEWFEHGSGWVFHGTPLSVVWKILREGMRAGEGHHYKNGRTVRGQFFIVGEDLLECLQHARDRASVVRCTEWCKFNVPSGWSVPCVIAFRQSREELVQLGKVGNCEKVALERTSGFVLKVDDLMRRSFHMYFRLQEMLAYRKLHELTDGVPMDPAACVSRLKSYVICGGMCGKPLVWASKVPASCGRCTLEKNLLMESDEWHQAISGVWRCRECYFRLVNEIAR